MAEEITTVPTYEKLAKKEPNDILMLWITLHPLEEEEVKVEEESKEPLPPAAE